MLLPNNTTVTELFHVLDVGDVVRHLLAQKVAQVPKMQVAETAMLQPSNVVLLH